MKRNVLFITLISFIIFTLTGCKRDMNYIICNEPSVTGIVEEINDNYATIYCEQMEGYPDGAKCNISLDVENDDSNKDFSVGDKIIVYYDGVVIETNPLKINKVYAILVEPN